MSKNEQINIRISQEDKSKLQAIAELKNLSMSEVIRKWITVYYDHMFEESRDMP